MSFKNTNDEGETIYPYGEDGFGRIVYGENGKMAVILMRLRRDAREDGGFFAYTGGYTVDEEASTVTHHVEACVAPGWVGSDRVRRFELLGEDRIALRPQEGTSELVWRREK